MSRTYAACAFVFLSLLVLAGCDCSATIGPSGNPCSGDSPIAGCGSTCSATLPCRAGLYCATDGRCTADCVAGMACSSGTCSSDGHCIAGSDLGPRDAQPVDGPAIDNTCASVTVGATRVTPNVILVIDQSGSMDENFGGGDTRWEALRDSLLAMPDGPIFSLQGSVRFGVAMYTSASSCPRLVTIPAAFDNYTAIQTEYARQRPANGTPTGDSISAVLGMLDTLAPVRTDPTILILATDGEPDTCEDGDDEVGGRRESIAAVTAAFGMDIETFVVSVGTGVAMTHLQDVANAGLGRSGSDPDAEFWVATDAAGLVTALETIIGGVTSCALELDGMIDPTAACSGEVRFSGDPPLTCGTDWRAVDATHIELLGAACDRLQMTGDTLSATFPCGVIIF